MQVSVEAPSKIQRRITIVVPVEKIDAAYHDQIQKIAKTAKVNGFRPGKVPLDVVKQRFGETAHQEALSAMIHQSLYSVIDQEKLSPVSTPLVEPKNAEPGQPLEFVATFEILPPVEKVNCDINQIEKQVAVVENEDVDQVIEHLREQHINWKEVNREAREKDLADVDFIGSIDGVPFSGGEAQNYPIRLGSKTMLPGFEEGIIGAKVGDERVITVPFPENYFAKEVAGKEAQFKIKVLKIREPELPALDENFVKKLSIPEKTVEGLRGEVRKNLERELNRVILSKLKQQVFDKILELNPLEIPAAIIKKEADRIHDELHPHHKGHAHNHSHEEMASFNEAAKRNVALGLIIGNLIKQYNMTPDRERVVKAIETIASAFEKQEEAKKYYATNKRAKAEVEMQVLEDQLVEKLLEGVQVTEKKMRYSELARN